MSLPGAGETARPAVFVAPDEIHDMAYTLVRVLDDANKAVGPWNPSLTPERLRLGLRYMLLTRRYDERMQRMQRQGKMSFYMQCTGEEAIAVAQGMTLEPGDMLFPSYRQQGLLIARERNLVVMMCQCLSNLRDPLKGRQMPIMYSSKEGRFFSISGNLATQFPQAVGWAMGAAYKGESDIASGWIGDGSTAEPDFHHALTFAAVYQAPVVLNIVNNQWAISSPQTVAGGEQSTFAARGIGYGIPSLRVDGNDFLAVTAVTHWAAQRARQGGGPTLIEHYTYRVAAHSTSDDPSQYRSKKESDEWPLGDPIDRLKNHLIDSGEWSEKQHAELDRQLKGEVLKAWEEAASFGTLDDGIRHPSRDMFEHVYKDMPVHLQRQNEQMKAGD
jgi:2-oxoisovalerate dehydrogenase E1 component alpha subunit